MEHRDSVVGLCVLKLFKGGDVGLIGAPYDLGLRLDETAGSDRAVSGTL